MACYRASIFNFTPSRYTTEASAVRKVPTIGNERDDGMLGASELQKADDVLHIHLFLFYEFVEW